MATCENLSVNNLPGAARRAGLEGWPVLSKVDWEPSPANQAFSSIQPRLVLQEGEGPGSDLSQATESCSVLSQSPSSALSAGSSSSRESLCHEHTGPLPGLCSVLLDRELSQSSGRHLGISKHSRACSIPRTYAPQEVVLLHPKQPLWTKQAGLDKALCE